MATQQQGIRQNYHEKCELGVNTQIELEMYAFYTYLSMSGYFDREDIALPNFAAYFRKAAHEELEHAQLFMKYQNERGGRILLADIKKPAKDEWGTGLEAMESALELEKRVNQSLLDLHSTSDEHKDYHLSDFIEQNFLTEQVEAIKEISTHVTNLRRVGGKGHGEYHFERNLK